ncbi:MAG: hypothetical protein JRH18_03860 [Deltaproteobacteria bacterium]|nr:hypothetical protein [Deltaproteobacteria bacterium]MBW2150785.1 hypothetical protein [Deltaproteobacteria bacterium]
MDKLFWAWCFWFVFLFIIDFILPFSLLKDIPKLTGSFLFWVIWIVVAIISMFLIFLRWHDIDNSSTTE